MSYDNTKLRQVIAVAAAIFPLSFALPVSAQSLGLEAAAGADCIKNGNCSLDSIVRTGAAFANLLTEISAVLFFVTFIYGGAMYLLSFGEKSRVEKGKKAITGGAIGMLIVLFAWTLVNFLVSSLLGAS